MHIETERKFLVRDESYKSSAVRADHIRQGYVAHEGGNTVRVRIRDGQGWLTIKGKSTQGGMSRPEWEKEIPLGDAEALMHLCIGGTLETIRHIVPAGETVAPGGRTAERFFEVDEFLGDNAGLTVAEIEVGDAGEIFARPAWLGEEVTGDRRYYNSYLVQKPYKEW